MLNHFFSSAAIFLGASLTSIGQLPIDWNLSLGGSNTDRPNQVASTPDGGALVVGRTSSEDFDLGLGGADGVVLKLDSSGELEWLNRYGGSEDDSLDDVVALSDGSCIVVGSSESADGDLSSNHGAQDLWILKLTSDGEVVWSVNYGGSNDDKAKALIMAQNNKIVVLGQSQSDDVDVSVNHGQSDVWLLTLSAEGMLEWEKTLGGSSHDAPSDVIQLADGGLMVLAGTESSDFDVSFNYSGESGDGEDCWVVKLNQTGEIIWAQNFGGSGEDSPDQLIQSEDGNYIICGRTSSQDFDVTDPQGANDGWILKIDGEAQLIWSKALGGSETDWIRSIVKAQDGGYFFAGYSESSDGSVLGHYGGYDCWFGKLSETGQILWSQNLGGSSDDRASAMSIQENGTIVVAGYSTSSDFDVEENHGGYDFWLFGLAPDDTQGFWNLPPPLPFELYPNPATDQVTIRSQASIECLELLDAMGRILWRGQVSNEVHVLDVSELNRGVYSLRATRVTGTAHTQRVVLR
ncbi:MAG: T9SS type A sorting domain-containing protein [Flavobacteriales bacterium]